MRSCVLCVVVFLLFVGCFAEQSLAQCRSGSAAACSAAPLPPDSAAPLPVFVDGIRIARLPLIGPRCVNGICTIPPRLVPVAPVDEPTPTIAPTTRIKARWVERRTSRVAGRVVWHIRAWRVGRCCQ